VDRHSRPLQFAAGAVVVAVAAVVVVEWPRLSAWRRPPSPDLPAPGDVAQMRAAVWASGSNGNLETDVPWFSVPGPAARRLWKRFQPNAYVANPPVNPDAPLGEMVVTAHDGGTTWLRFYETGQDGLIFTVDGKHFYRAEPRDDRGSSLGGGLFLAGTLRHAAVVAERGGRLPSGEITRVRAAPRPTCAPAALAGALAVAMPAGLTLPSHVQLVDEVEHQGQGHSEQDAHDPDLEGDPVGPADRGLAR
jgi:hypothetical protein